MSEFRAALQALVDSIGDNGSIQDMGMALSAAKALLARPEPAPRITREEAMRLLDNLQTAYARMMYQKAHLGEQYDDAREACLAAMGVSESPPAASDEIWTAADVDSMEADAAELAKHIVPGKAASEIVMHRYTFDRGRGRELFILATEVDAHLAALQAQHAEAELVIADLAMMLRRMIHRIRRTGSGTEIANAATDLLKRHGQQGSILRQGMP